NGLAAFPVSPPAIGTKKLIWRCDHQHSRLVTDLPFRCPKNPGSAAGVIIAGYQQKTLGITPAQFFQDPERLLAGGKRAAGDGGKPRARASAPDHVSDCEFAFGLAIDYRCSAHQHQRYISVTHQLGSPFNAMAIIVATENDGEIGFCGS